MHSHNPVNWYPWGAEALAKAKAENKLIFLSIGYSASAISDEEVSGIARSAIDLLVAVD